jgi:hypothetical protein
MHISYFLLPIGTADVTLLVPSPRTQFPPETRNRYMVYNIRFAHDTALSIVHVKGVTIIRMYSYRTFIFDGTLESETLFAHDIPAN